MPPRKSANKQEGGIDLTSESASITGREVVGRDNIKGLTGKDVVQLVDTLLKHFPQRYLDNPEELDKTLSDFRGYHEKLHEYKELHNAVNDILIAFEQFRAEMDRANTLRAVPELSVLRKRWRPVSMNVVALLNWSQTIKSIGKPFQLLADKSKSGEDWAIQFSGLQSRINEHLGMSDQLAAPDTTKEDIGYPSQLQIISFQRLGTRIPWWETLSELTSSFSDASSHHMNSADKQLRQTAQELYNLSNKALSNY